VQQLKPTDDEDEYGGEDYEEEKVQANDDRDEDAEFYSELGATAAQSRLDLK
jgi:hypothetical protein